MPEPSASHTIELCRRQLQFALVRASGPGGQNVNKVATAVQLRFDLGASPSLDPQTKKRMAQFAGRRLSTAGILVIHAGRFRTQAGNRADALARFTSLLEKSLARPTKRLQTKASAASKERRLRSKKIRAEIKRTRRNPGYV